jgi:hypothetical protein
VLLPDLSEHLAELSTAIRQYSPKVASEARSRATGISRTFMRAHGFTLPHRLLDNLLTRYAKVIAWPERGEVLLNVLETARLPKGWPTNSRAMLDHDLDAPAN